MGLNHLVYLILVTIGISITRELATNKIINRKLSEDDYQAINNDNSYQTKNNITIPPFKLTIQKETDSSLDDDVFMFVLERHVEYMFEKYFPSDELLDLVLGQDYELDRRLLKGRKALMLSNFVEETQENVDDSTQDEQDDTGDEVTENEETQENANDSAQDDEQEDAEDEVTENEETQEIEENSSNSSEEASSSESTSNAEEIPNNQYDETFTLSGYIILNSMSSTTAALSQKELMSNFIAKSFKGQELEKLLKDYKSYEIDIISIIFQIVTIPQPVPIGDDNMRFTVITGLLFAGTIVFITASAYAVYYANKKTSFLKKDNVIDKASTSSSDCGSTKGDYAYDDETLERIEGCAPNSDSSSCTSYDYSVQNGCSTNTNSFCGSSINDDDSATLGELGEICDKVGSILDDLDATSMIADAIYAETPMISNLSMRKKSLNQSSSNSYDEMMGVC